MPGAVSLFHNLVSLDLDVALESQNRTLTSKRIVNMFALEEIGKRGRCEAAACILAERHWTRYHTLQIRFTI